MKPVRTFVVVPSLPPPLERLRGLAHNLRWAWHHDTMDLFLRLDSDLWEKTGHNPVAMLGTISQEHLEAAATDEGFLAHLERVARDLDTYLTDDITWFQRTHGSSARPLIAYFSAEFGLTECLSIFAGGLGVLAGDHLKSASDLGVPLVGVGLLYQQGYFHQHLNSAGWQQEDYKDNDFHNLPLTLERQPNGAPLTITVAYPDHPVVAQVWRAQVGRVPLYLLDANIPANRPEDRAITHQLYGGDLEMRIRQEIMLGIGGYRVLAALGLHPTVYHMNEGHSAFVALEQIRSLMMAHHLSFAEAQEAAAASLVFTTHTPVPAGHDYFPPELTLRFFGDYAHSLGLSHHDFLALGRHDSHNAAEPFCMTILALRLAAYSNGVSRLHGQTTRQMWRKLWPQTPVEEIPIGHVTNGVHFRSWISHEMDRLYDRYLGPRWREEPANQTVWQRAGNIAAEELWRTHERRRERLVAFARRQLRAQLEQRGAPQAEIEATDEVLDPKALTIGFARRFATYKRANLLLHDPERLERIINNADHPVQIIFAGKAHPKDEKGKELIQQIVELSRQEPFQRHLVFLEDYGMAAARYLVQGADVWLNTPLRPLEASGTSGMKAAANGVLNLSTLDGWWYEAYQPEVGWALGNGKGDGHHDSQDRVEAEALYDLLERDVIPTFYDRRADALPRRWIERMKASIGGLCSFFNANRMVQEYTGRFYLPAATRYRRLADKEMAGAKHLAAWKTRVQKVWPQIRLEMVEAEPLAELRVGDDVRIRARVHLGDLKPEEVTVELYLGRVDATGEIVEAEAAPMQYVASETEDNHLFEAQSILCRQSGLHGYSVRVLPHHPELVSPFLSGLIVWADAM